LKTSKYDGNRMKSDTEDSIIWILKPKKTKIGCPVFLDFIWYEKTMKRDKDNVAFAKKFILDAMQKAGMLPNDNNQYIKGFTDNFIYGKEDKVKVIVRVKE
jgi:Holliday junction resolvase RusA-like endonuclease